MEDDADDVEILVCRMEELTDVITLPILVRHRERGNTEPAEGGCQEGQAEEGAER